MPISQKYFAPFQAGNFYHVFNHANGTDNLFNNDKDYSNLKQALHDSLGDKVDILAWCFMPNHYHLLIQVNIKG